MHLSVHEATTPYRTLVGNAAWVLMHTAPYNTEGFQTCELHAGEAKCTKRAFAIRVAAMVEAIVAAYPCGSCRVRAGEILRKNVADLKAYAKSVSEKDAVHHVEDELAIRIFKMHNAVSKESDRNTMHLDGKQLELHSYILDIEIKTLAMMEKGMEDGSVPRYVVGRLLRKRWKK